jgi:hypothetical protein
LVRLQHRNRRNRLEKVLSSWPESKAWFSGRWRST